MPTAVKPFTGQYTCSCLRKPSSLPVSTVEYFIKQFNFYACNAYQNHPVLTEVTTRKSWDKTIFSVEGRVAAGGCPGSGVHQLAK
jgi:hypothetical protein